MFKTFFRSAAIYVRNKQHFQHGSMVEGRRIELWGCVEPCALCNRVSWGSSTDVVRRWIFIYIISYQNKGDKKVLINALNSRNFLILHKMQYIDKIPFKYLVNSVLRLTHYFPPSFPWTFTQKEHENVTTKLFKTKHCMFGVTNLRQQRKFTKPLVVMVETFRRSEPLHVRHKLVFSQLCAFMTGSRYRRMSYRC